MKTKCKEALLVVSFFFAVVALSTPLFAGQLSAGPSDKVIATRKSKHVVTTLVNKTGKFKGGVNGTLRRTRGAVNEIHRYLIPVTKGLQKPAS